MEDWCNQSMLSLACAKFANILKHSMIRTETNAPKQKESGRLDGRMNRNLAGEENGSSVKFASFCWEKEPGCL